MSKTNSWYAYSGLKYVQHLLDTSVSTSLFKCLYRNLQKNHLIFLFSQNKRDAQTMQKTQLYSKSTSRIQSFRHWKFHYRQECFFKNSLMEIIPSTLSVPILKTLELDFYDERRFISLCFNLRHFRHLIIEMGTSHQQRFGKFHKIGFN